MNGILNKERYLNILRDNAISSKRLTGLKFTFMHDDNRAYTRTKNVHKLFKPIRKEQFAENYEMTTANLQV